MLWPREAWRRPLLPSRAPHPLDPGAPRPLPAHSPWTALPGYHRAPYPTAEGRNARERRGPSSPPLWTKPLPARPLASFQAWQGLSLWQPPQPCGRNRHSSRPPPGRSPEGHSRRQLIRCPARRGMDALPGLPAWISMELRHRAGNPGPSSRQAARQPTSRALHTLMPGCTARIENGPGVPAARVSPRAASEPSREPPRSRAAPR